MFEIRTDSRITSGPSGDTVTLEDVRGIHGFPDPGNPEAPTGEGLTVAVMDSGVDDAHPVFEGVDVEHHNFTDAPDDPRDEVGHGTAVAGLVAQLAPAIETIVDLRIFGESGRANSQPIFDAYDWTLDHADRVDVINLSWGASGTVADIDREHTKLLEAGVADAVAAGNTGAEGGSPATATDAFGVGAMTEGKELTRFSSYNPGEVENPDVVALGKDVRLPRAEGTSLGTVIDDRWVKASGTSFSAPIAAAALTLYLDAHGSTSEKPFERTARDIPGTPRDVHGYLRYGHAAQPRERETSVQVFDLPSTGDDAVTLPTGWLSDPTRATLERQEARETVVRFER